MPRSSQVWGRGTICQQKVKERDTFSVKNAIQFRACLHGGGGPQIGEVTCSGSPHLPCKRDQIKMRGYMDRPVTPPERVTSPTWGPPPPCKQALNLSTTATLATEESGRCREVLNKSQCMDLLSAGRKNAAVIERWPLAEVRLYKRLGG